MACRMVLFFLVSQKYIVAAYIVLACRMVLFFLVSHKYIVMVYIVMACGSVLSFSWQAPASLDGGGGGGVFGPFLGGGRGGGAGGEGGLRGGGVEARGVVEVCDKLAGFSWDGSAARGRGPCGNRGPGFPGVSARGGGSAAASDSQRPPVRVRRSHARERVGPVRLRRSSEDHDFRPRRAVAFCAGPRAGRRKKR